MVGWLLDTGKNQDQNTPEQPARLVPTSNPLNHFGIIPAIANVFYGINR